MIDKVMIETVANKLEWHAKIDNSKGVPIMIASEAKVLARILRTALDMPEDSC